MEDRCVHNGAADSAILPFAKASLEARFITVIILKIQHDSVNAARRSHQMPMVIDMAVTKRGS
jgi:hypothetical protein